MSNLLDYYRRQSPLSDPGVYVHLYQDLPDEPAEMVRVIQNILLHKLAAQAHNITHSPQQRAEQRLRTIEERLERISQFNNSLLTPRAPEERQVGICRDFALFFVSMLRHKGFPARMRVGYASYLDPNHQFNIDHWITEYWHEAQQRWVLTDAEIDPEHFHNFRMISGTPDLRYDHDFYLAGSAWKNARAGKISSTLFRFNGSWKGFPCIRGNLLHDFQALNRIELGVFDYWDDLSIKSESQLSVQDKAMLDQVAELTLRVDDQFDALQELFEDMPRTQQVRSKMRLLGIIGDDHIQATPDLRDSDRARLEALASGVGEPRRKPKPRPQFVDEYIPYDVPPDSPLAAMQANHAQQFVPSGGDILVRGARQHNLKNIDVHIPRNKLVVITGVSGSGKSSLAFDTIYAEGQRRYVESLSSYARQFMGQMEKPQVDHIAGLSPAIAIEQKTVSRNPRSTVGTVTEILDYLRVLYARVGTPHCPECGRAVEPQSAQQISNQLSQLAPGTRFQLLAPIARKRKGTFATALKSALKDGYTRARVDGEFYDLTQEHPKLDKNIRHNIELIVDRLVVPDESDAESRNAFLQRLMDSTETALRAGEGILIVVLDEEELVLSEHHACPVCDISFPELSPNLFSFNSPLGMCPECNGLGIKLQVDPDLIITQPHLSLMDGASPWYGNIRKKKNWRAHELEAIANEYNTNIEIPWNEMPEEFRNTLLYGSNGKKFHFSYENEEGTWSGESYRETKGIIHHVNRLFRQTKSEYTRRWYMSFMSKLPCPTCNGERLNAQARFVSIDGIRLPELTGKSIAELYDWIEHLPATLNDEQAEIGAELIEEIRQRLGFIKNVGLHYLTLDRPAPTLSGGEGQRIRLASQIGSGLVGVMYILDEPSIGLHTRDHRSLLDTLQRLRDTGNTVMVVEHDEATMRAADWIIDLGPGAGMLGGELVAAGTPEDLANNPDSLTGRYLSGERSVTAPNGFHRREPLGTLTLRGATLHNLKNIDLSIPLGTFTCITGVSGSGKSSLIGQTLTPALSRILHNTQSTPGHYDAIDGLEQINKIINITQDPIGRNPRSNPGTYVGVLPEIRKVFAETTEAKARGYSATRFSFNTKGGRCEVCKGYGYKKVEMHFLADVWVKCTACDGQRFNRQTLEITYKDRNIAQILDMDVQEAMLFFENHPKIHRMLVTLHDVGLDYIKLGQSALTLSGGEAQRIKLAKELSRVSTGKTLYVLDEPTTGLHFADIQHLLDVLHRLVAAGNTVLVIEHNLDVIRTADWIVDLGPEGGDKGGEIIAEGTPEDLTHVERSFTGHYLQDVLHPS